MQNRHVRAQRALRTILALASAGLVACALAACARSPQTVMLSPTLTGPPGQVSPPRSVELVVVDKRNSLVIGSRGGLYSETSTISTEEDIRPGIRDAVARALEKQGYRVLQPGEAADMQLTVDLQKLTYAIQGTDVVLTEIKVSAAVGATCRKGGDTLSSRYETNQTRKMATAPDAAENSKIINDVVGKSIDEMLADNKLRDFMME